MTTVNLNRLDNCVLNAQRISASNGEGSNNSTALAKNYTPLITHRVFYTLVLQKRTLRRF